MQKKLLRKPFSKVLRKAKAIIAVDTDGCEPELSRDLKNFIKELNKISKEYSIDIQCYTVPYADFKNSLAFQINAKLQNELFRQRLNRR